MSSSQILHQIESLMKIQQRRCAITNRTAHYNWSSKKRAPLIYLSTKQECVIRQLIQKMTEGDKMIVMKSLIVWLNEHPLAEAEEIPEVFVKALNRTQNQMTLKHVNLMRTGSLRQRLASFLRSNGWKRLKFVEKPAIYYIKY